MGLGVCPTRYRLKSDLATAQKEIESKQRELSEQQGELGKVQERVLGRGKEIENLRQEKDALGVHNARLERQRDQSVADLDRMKEDNNELCVVLSAFSLCDVSVSIFTVRCIYLSAFLFCDVSVSIFNASFMSAFV